MEIEKLAELARINLSSEEKETLQKEFEAILNYVSLLEKANINNVSDEKENIIFNVLREDKEETKKCEPENLIKVAPFYENNFVKVKHVFEN